MPHPEHLKFLGTLGAIPKMRIPETLECVIEPTRETWFYEHRVPEGQKAYYMTKPIRVEHLAPCVAWWGGATRKGRIENEVAWKVTAEEVNARGYNLDFKNPNTIADEHDDPELLLKKLGEAEGQAAISALRTGRKTIKSDRAKVDIC